MEILKRIYTEEIVLLHEKGFIQSIVKFRTEKILCKFLSSSKYSFEGHELLCTRTTALQYSKKERIKTYI